MTLAEESRITIIGNCNFRGDNRTFGIRRADRRQHVYLIGKTGTGKTTTLAGLIVQDIQRGEGVAVVDPAGDLAEAVLNYIPPRRINDVIYFNPADSDFPIGFNVLETRGPGPGFEAEKNLVSSGLISVLKKLWSDSWGPRLEHVLRNTILALLDTPGNTLLGIPRMLVDETFREKIVSRVSDPVVKAFWTDEFANYDKGFRAEAISPIQNKVGQFLSSSLIRNIVAQPRSTINLRAVMDEGKILVLNLAKGRIGEDNAALLGAMMITKLQLAAMSRSELPEQERRDFYLFVDEFQNFATESFAGVLSEARKFRLNLTVSHQYIEQLPKALRGAVFGNVGTLVAFRVGAGDAEYLEDELGRAFGQADLVGLENYHAYIRLTIDGIPARPFSMQTLPFPAWSSHFGQHDKVIRVSRERYAQARPGVESRIARWSGTVAIGATGS